MLNASFGCISYLRGIFPDDDFFEERYNASKATDPRTLKHGRHAANQGGQRVMRLRRNVSSGASSLLDYLVCSIHYSTMAH